MADEGTSDQVSLLQEGKEGHRRSSSARAASSSSASASASSPANELELLRITLAQTQELLEAERAKSRYQHGHLIIMAVIVIVVMTLMIVVVVVVVVSIIIITPPQPPQSRTVITGCLLLQGPGGGAREGQAGDLKAQDPPFGARAGDHMVIIPDLMLCMVIIIAAYCDENPYATILLIHMRSLRIMVSLTSR
jgi:hypothetical protein